MTMKENLKYSVWFQSDLELEKKNDFSEFLYVFSAIC